MRAAFTLAILCLAIFYSWIAFTGLNWLSPAGRLGPGFFPRIIGLLLIAVCLYSLVMDYRQRRGREEAASPFWAVTLAIVALTAVFVAMLNVLGGVLAMVAFMLAALTLLNRGRPVQNVVLSLALPLAVYFLFDVWLNARMPESMLPLPL